MERNKTGRKEKAGTGEEEVRAFIPDLLSARPPLELDGTRQRLIERSTLALGRLDSITTLLPDPQFFLYAYIRREAVLSSQIEGTQSSLSDLLLFELEKAPGVAFDDVVQVSDCVAALEHGMARLRAGFPLSNRLISELQEKLSSRGRGREKKPGALRRSRDWAGGTGPGNAQSVPPPGFANEPVSALARAYYDAEPPYAVLVTAALAHAQFETIHPFRHGNGRVGRLLIPLLLCSAGVLQQPLLYLSLYLKQHRDEYYRLLERVRTTGDWEAWLDFFLEGVTATATSAVETAQRLVALFGEDMARARSAGRRAATMLNVLQALRERPVLTVNAVSRRTGLSFPTAAKGMTGLVDIGLARELTGYRRNRVFAYDRCLTILDDGTEPL
jgi:Fic family protein